MNAAHRLLDSLIQFHNVTSVSVAPGYAWVSLDGSTPQKEMLGSRPFIGTTQFQQLQKDAVGVEAAVDGLESSSKEKFTPMWRAIAGLLPRLKAQKQTASSASIDDAFQLLYVASGTLCHYAAQFFGMSPVATNGATISSVERLLSGSNFPAEWISSSLEKLTENLAKRCKDVL